MKKILLCLILAILVATPTMAQKKIKGMYMSVDEFTGNAIYMRKTEYTFTTPGTLILYLSKPKNGDVRLIARIGYRGSDWLFFDKAQLKCNYNGEELLTDIPFSVTDKKTNVLSSGTCNEYVNVVVCPELLDYLRKMIESESAMMRLEGSKHYDNHNLTKLLGGYRQVIDIYDNFARKQPVN